MPNPTILEGLKSMEAELMTMQQRLEDFCPNSIQLQASSTCQKVAFISNQLETLTNCFRRRFQSLNMRALPPEIWRTILIFASSIPGALTTSPPTLFDQLAEKYSKEKKYRASLKTKTSIMLVCKAWKEIGIELLYEDIRLHSDAIHHLDKLAILFEKGVDALNQPCRFGWWTKRLDIPSSFIESTPTFATLCRFLRCCHRLSIFLVRGYVGDIEESTIPTLHSALGNSQHALRRIECHNFGYIDTHPIYLYPNLETIELSFSDQPQFLPLIELRNITSLGFNGGLGPEADLWDFPNLQRLNLSDIESQDIPILIPFFDEHGRRLTSLRVTSDSVPFHAELQPLLDRTLYVKELVLDYYLIDFYLSDVDDMLETERHYPAVTHLGVEGHKPSCNDNFIMGVKSTFPSLICIRFLDTILPFTLQAHPKTVDLCWKKGVRVEDIDGHLVVEKLPAKSCPAPE